MTTLTSLWTIFGVTVVGMLILDLFFFHRKAHEVRMREALTWSVIWIVLALIFGGGIWFYLGQESAMKFLTGYVVEKSLSVDNLFVFLVIFTYFKISPRYQHKILFWGIIGALLTRALFISTGVALVHSLHWMIYVFGAFLIVTGIKLAFQSDDSFRPDKNIMLRLYKRFFPLSTDTNTDRFFIREAGTLLATPLFVTLIVVETTDVVFALDSIPAILGITTDPFLVYTSNIFAILGLRALYFALAAFMKLFKFLHYGLSLILVFIGVKMLTESYIHLSTGIELAIVGGILTLSVVASILFKEKQ